MQLLTIHSRDTLEIFIFPFSEVKRAYILRIEHYTTDTRLFQTMFTFIKANSFLPRQVYFLTIKICFFVTEEYNNLRMFPLISSHILFL